MQPDYLLLTGAILCGYAFALWRLLRGETASCLWAVAALAAAALGLRLVDYTNYPGGLTSDETTVLLMARRALADRNLFGEGSTGLPQLIPVLFEAQLTPLVGFNRWAIRTYSLVGAVLSVPATFAVARAMRMRPISALAAAAFVAVLPWSIFYGRISQGGELLFNQLLLLAALARLIWKNGTWREIPAGALGLCLLFYDYFSGRSMLAMPLVGAVLAKGRGRLWSLAIGVVAMIGFLPQALQGHRYALVGLSMLEVHDDYTANPFVTLWLKFVNALWALAYPVATNGWMTVTTGAMHPWLILALAALGLLTGFRRALFLTGGFVAGLMPSILAHGDLAASTHRMHAAFVFIALAAGASFDLVPWRTVRGALATATVVFASWWSVTFYFSPSFWTEEATWQFDNAATDLVESIPAGEPLIVDGGLATFISFREDLLPQVENFSAERSLLDKPGLYLFPAAMAPLQPLYASLLAPEAIRRFGRAFSVRVDHGDMSWLRQHGWSYQATCGESTRSGQVLALFHWHSSFENFVCDQPAEHVWRARWHGAAAKLRLWFSGKVTVETEPGTVVSADAPAVSLDFDVQPGALVTVRLTSPGTPLAGLYVITRNQERLPHWESVSPVALPAPPRLANGG